MTHWDGRRVLVTGITGFLGANVVDRLLYLGAEVHGVARSSAPIHSVHLLTGDLTSPDFVRLTFREVKPDIVIHLAGQTNASTDKSLILPTFQGNLETTVNVLAAAADVNCSRIVVTGSLEELEASVGDDVLPMSPYALSKWGTVLYGRAFHAMYHAPVVIVRPFMTYGPRQRQTKLVPYVALSLLQGKAPRIKTAERHVDWVYIEDVVEGMLAAAIAPGVEGRTIDLGSGIRTSVRQVVTELVSVVGTTVSPSFEQDAAAYSNNDRVADLAKAALWLKWKPKTTLRDGLAQTVEWYKAYLDQGMST
jgi:nucleoside-diphosphate-sugar epimerase